MPSRTVTHASFVIERDYAASPSRVFAAFADPAQKRRWFAEGEGWSIERFDVDFRIGGSERSSFRYQGGPQISNDTTYQDIVPDRRIVSAYTMTIAGEPISASLATVELVQVGSGTRLVYTEQAAFLDGKDEVSTREAGSRELLESLAQELERTVAAV